MADVADPAYFGLDIVPGARRASFTHPNSAPSVPEGDERLAHGIFNVIARYRLRNSLVGPDLDEEQRKTFLSLLVRMVRSRSCIQLVLPAFPFKSPNSRDKVLGTLPDKAEEVSLGLLQGLCDSIRDVYEPGALLTIVSDGIVYNDLLGVSDLTVWRYGEDLRLMAISNGHRSIEFARISQASGVMELPEELTSGIDDEKYQALAPLARQKLEETFGTADFDVDKFIKEDESARATYKGYIKFLTVDLAHTVLKPNGTTFSSGSSDNSSSVSSTGSSKSALKRHAQKVAKQMMTRGKCFAKLIKQAWPEAIRLSIHASNSPSKISIGVLPNLDFGAPMTPWHCTLLCKLDGSFIALKRANLENWPRPVEPVYSHGRLYCYRESSDLYNWGSVSATFDHLYPCGLRITALQPASQYVWVPMNKLRKLAELTSPVILRGFQGADNEETFISKAGEMGEIQSWKFGALLKVKDGGGEKGGLNNVLSTEPMPFHFDGLFKIVDGKPRPPRFQVFTATTASPKGTGRTLFAPSRLLFQNLPNPYSIESLRSLTWTVRTPAFEAAHLSGLPLIGQHPETKLPVLRYHEHWPRQRTVFDETLVTFDRISEDEGQEVRKAIESALYDRRVCTRIEWGQGDVLLNDNVGVMHTREGFSGSQNRELWRIHVD